MDANFEDTQIDDFSDSSGFIGDRVESLDTDIEEIDLDSIETTSTEFGSFETNVADRSSETAAEIQTPELDANFEDTQIDDFSDSIESRFDADSATINNAATSGFVGDRIESLDTDIEEIDLSADVSTTSGFNSNIIEDTSTTSENFDINLDEITFDDEDDSVDTSLEDINLDNIDNSVDASLDEITFDNADSSIDSSLDEITFDDVDSSSDIDLDDITFNDIEDNSPKQTTNEINNANRDDFDIDLDELGFDTSTDDTNTDLLNGNAAKIAEPSKERSDDMDNISTWLDSLETPSQNSEDITGWLDRLNTKNEDARNKSEGDLDNVKLDDDTEDISFQFLEDLLERDSEKDNS